MDVLCRRGSFDSDKLASLAAEFSALSWQPPMARWRRWLRNAVVLGRTPAEQLRALVNDDLRGDLVPLAAALRSRAGGHDIYHAHFGPQGELLARLRLLGILSKPLIVSFHGYDLTRVVAACMPDYRYLRAGADRIVVTTRFMQGKAEALGYRPEQIRRIPVGVSLEDFEFRARVWSPQQCLKILTVARLVPQKAVDRAIKAVAALVAQGLSVQYQVIGEGPCRKRLHALCQELGVEHCVEFLGGLPRAAVKRALGDSHVFLFPCTVSDMGDEEGQGIVLLEAQACGLPILTTRHGGIPETVAPGKSALVVADCQEAINQGLAELVVSYQDWPTMGACGRDHVARHFTLTQHLDALQALYDEFSDSAQGRA